MLRAMDVSRLPVPAPTSATRLLALIGSVVTATLLMSSPCAALLVVIAIPILAFTRAIARSFCAPIIVARAQVPTRLS